MNSGTGPVPQVAYSVLKEDLFFPCRRAQFFPGGPPDSEAVLCAEMSRLAYCRAEPSFDFDQTRIRSEVARAGFTIQERECGGARIGRPRARELRNRSDGGRDAQ